MRLTLFLLLVALTYNSVVSSSKGLMQAKNLDANSQRELTNGDRRKLRDGVVEGDTADVEETVATPITDPLDKFANNFKARLPEVSPQVSKTMKNFRNVAKALKESKLKFRTPKVSPRVTDTTPWEPPTYLGAQVYKKLVMPIKHADGYANKLKFRTAPRVTKTNKRWRYIAKAYAESEAIEKVIEKTVAKAVAPYERNQGNLRIKNSHDVKPDSPMKDHKTLNEINEADEAKLTGISSNLEKDTETTSKSLLPSTEELPKDVARFDKRRAPKPVEVDKGEDVPMEESLPL